jgi:hypothetical protein
MIFLMNNKEVTTRSLTETMLEPLPFNGPPVMLQAEREEMLDQVTWEQVNGEYEAAPNAGPAWRAARDYGFDMSLVDAFLKLSPEQRLAEHQQVINFLLEVQEAGQSHASG